MAQRELATSAALYRQRREMNRVTTVTCDLLSCTIVVHAYPTQDRKYRVDQIGGSRDGTVLSIYKGVST
jgi:hypothetical protein